MKDVTSKHLRTSTELTVIAPIKQGFVENVDTMTYASRLRLLLNVLFELRKGADERSAGVPRQGNQELEYVGPLERLQTLHFVQWAVFDDDTKLMLNVTFDRSWESYIRDIVDIAGPLLDIILCHCADYEGHASSLGYERFSQWVRAHQVENDFFFSAEPGLTSDDRRLHKKLAALPTEIVGSRTQHPAAPLGAELEERVTALRLTAVRQSGGTLRDLQRIAGALFDLRRYFAGGVTPTHASYLSASARQDLVFFDEVAFELLSGFGALLREPVQTPSERLLASWYATLSERRRTRPDPDPAGYAPIPSAALPDIQRGVLTAFPSATHGCLALLQWPDRVEGARVLAALRSQISVEGGAIGADGPVSLALTYQGLASLDLTEDELRAFPKEFRDGMEARSGILGDVEAAHPSEWQLPKANQGAAQGSAVALSSVDAVLLLQCSPDDAQDGDHAWSDRHPLRRRLSALLADTKARVLHVQPLRREYQGGAMIEHFGFRDDISQPHVAFEPPAGAPAPDVLPRDRVAPGEIVLGYPNARGETVRFAINGGYDPGFDLLKNGTFLVLRKLEQHVAWLDAFIEQSVAALAAEGAGVSAAELKAQIMGRKPGIEATPVIQSPPHGPGLTEQQRLNDFDFAGEPNRCPFHAHIRRVNPREALLDDEERTLPQRTTARIVRRSFAFGPTAGCDAYEDEAHERGLMFMALNASIADQYEIIQRWVNGGNSTGVSSALSDLIAGANKSAFPVQTPKGVRWLAPPPRPLVSLRWGMYAFVPSITAIDHLIRRASAPSSKAELSYKTQLVVRGLGIVAKLQALPEALARFEWKRLLENREAADDTRAIWAAVMQTGGALRTPYGVLVAGKRNVYEVLQRSDTYSVREYWRRMDDSIGRMHLGMDPDRTTVPAERATHDDRYYEAEVQPDTYAGLAGPLNAAIAAIGFEHGLRSARLAAAGMLGGLPLNADTGTKVCDVRDASAAVLQEVSSQWFGMPSSLRGDPPAKSSSLADFRQCSAYVFTVQPEAWVAAGAKESANTIRAAYELNDYEAVKAAAQRHAALGLAPFPHEAPAQLADSLKGAAFGFLAATLGSVVSALVSWIESGQLWRLQQQLTTLGGPEPQPGTPEAAQRAAELDAVQRALIAALQRQPLPQVLHRQVVKAAQLGPVAVVPGDRVVAALATVAAEDPADEHIMFGGAYAPQGGGPVHACPGRKMAMGVMTGFIWTLLEQHDLRRVSQLSPLKLSFRPR